MWCNIYCTTATRGGDIGVTIRDVAQKTKLSTATVSRVLNNSPHVSERARLMVQQAARELGYTPPVFATAFGAQRQRTVGVLIPDISNFYYPAVVRVIETELSKQSLYMLLCNTLESIEKEKDYISNLLRNGVDGLMFLGTRPASRRDQHIVELSERLPVLLVNDHIVGSNVYSVMADEVEGAYKAVGYLIKMGHTRIAYVTGAVDYTTYKYKLAGYQRALSDNEIEFDPDLVVAEDPHEQGGHKAALRILRSQFRPTAIFAASDQMAVGVLQAYRQQGLSIPEDVSLIGFGDVPIASALYPPLTTVNQFPQRTGEIAADIMRKLIEKVSLDQKRIILEPQLAIRASCRSISK